MYSWLLILLVLPLYDAQAPLSGTFNTGSKSYDRFNQFMNTLSKTQPDGSITIHSSGGAAGGIVSEGQGYGLFIAASTAVALGTTNSNFNTVRDKAYNIFKGWKRMCKQSNQASSSCQTFLCTESGTSYPCLPHWKWADDLSSPAWGTGSAPDGDEDAILGMILLVEVTASAKPTWWNEVALWTYQSCKQFYDSSVDSTTNPSIPILKLGACWGGWDCSNPSYYAPGAYRAMRNYMSNYGKALSQPATEITSYVAKYNTLITNSYKLILANQNSAGLNTNWYKPVSGNLDAVGSTGCSGSGTPAAEWGAESSRIIPRVALDYLWFWNEVPVAAKTFLDKVNLQQCKNSPPQLATGGLVTSIFSNWYNEAFMYGPLFTALVRPTASTTIAQAQCLSSAISKINSAPISDYYAGSWVAIATLMLSGDLAKASSLVATTLGPVAPVVPVPVAPVAPVPVPVAPVPVPVAPVPVTPIAPGSLKCSLAGCAINPYWIEFLAPSGVTVSTAQVRCSDNSVLSCSRSGSKYQCQPAAGKSCNSPIPLINGASCPLSEGTKTDSVSCQNRAGMAINANYVEFKPPSGYSTSLASVKCNNGGLYITCTKDYNPKVGCDVPSGLTCTNPIPLYNGSPCPYSTTAAVAESTGLNTEATSISSVAIIGIAIGCVALVLLIVVVIIIKTRRNNEEEIV